MINNLKEDCIVRHGHIIESWENGHSERKFSCCGKDCTTMTQWMWPNYCPYCGAKLSKKIFLEKDNT